MQELLCRILVNQSITFPVFFHWFSPSEFRRLVLICSCIRLLTFPSSLLDGLISRHFGFDRKSSLWSFIVMKACVVARRSMRSSNSSFSAMLFASLLIMSIASEGAFL